MANSRPNLIVFPASKQLVSKKIVVNHISVPHRSTSAAFRNLSLKTNGPQQRGLSLQSLPKTSNVAKSATHCRPQLVPKSRPNPQSKPVIKLEPHTQIRIKDNSTGYSYAKVFGGILDDKVTTVRVDDPYVRSKHQDNSEKLKGQKSNLAEVQRSLQNHKVKMEIRLSNTLHDREIVIDNGWVVKIGRGLDYFKKNDSKFAIGVYDQHFRPCLETTIDIFYNRHAKI